jgi:cytochrome c oxidase subunit IV
MNQHVMKSYYNIHLIWLLMMLLTVSTYFIGALGYSGVIITLFLLATAVIKGGLIIRDFMELKGVALAWQIIMYGWLLVVCLAISVTYIIGIKL